MTDKLTDKDVIKALPNMTYGGHYCAKCKYDNGKGNDRCGFKGCKIARYALDLINRLQEENERLQNILICFMDALGKVRKVDDIDEISLIPLMSELNKQYRAELKAEAIKEFYEELHTEILAARDSNFKAKEERIAKSKEYGIPIGVEDSFLMYCDGKIHALDGIDYFAYETLKELVGEDNASKN